MNQGFLNTLVERAQLGDQKVWGEIYRLNKELVRYQVARFIRDPGRQDDITQDVFVAAYRKIHQLRDPVNFCAWLRRIARSLSLNSIYSAKHLRSLKDSPAPADEEELLIERLILKEEVVCLHIGIKHLNQIDQQALRLFYLEGRSLIEIGELLQIPIGTVKRRLHMARRRLRVELEENQPGLFV